MTKRKQDFVTWTGNDEKIEFTVYQDDGVTPLNISAGILYWIMKESRTATAALIEKETGGQGISITDGANGKCQVDLDPADTNGLEGAKYFHELKLTLSNETKTVSEGTVTIHRSGFSDLTP
jgi:hypothetical protein